MLDFLLVLGQIPGTNFQLSFWQIILLTAATWFGIRLCRRPALRRKYSYWLRTSFFYIHHFRSLRRLLN